jgi:hypothetical protein
MSSIPYVFNEHIGLGTTTSTAEELWASGPQLRKMKIKSVIYETNFCLPSVRIHRASLPNFCKYCFSPYPNWPTYSRIHY